MAAKMSARRSRPCGKNASSDATVSGGGSMTTPSRSISTADCSNQGSPASFAPDVTPSFSLRSPVKGRGFCPSCGAKRAAIFSELLRHQILADVPHAQWVFPLPKMLRPYFLYQTSLLNGKQPLRIHCARPNGSSPNLLQTEDPLAFRNRKRSFIGKRGSPT